MASQSAVHSKKKRKTAAAGVEAAPRSPQHGAAHHAGGLQTASLAAEPAERRANGAKAVRPRCGLQPRPQCGLALLPEPNAAPGYYYIRARCADSAEKAPRYWSRQAGKAQPVLDKMRERLQGGRFRWLNEQMYSVPGEESFQLMQVTHTSLMPTGSSLQLACAASIGSLGLTTAGKDSAVGIKLPALLLG